jgi:hypothetical protein
VGTLNRLSLATRCRTSTCEYPFSCMRLVMGDGCSYSCFFLRGRDQWRRLLYVPERMAVLHVLGPARHRRRRTRVAASTAGYPC